MSDFLQDLREANRKRSKEFLDRRPNRKEFSPLEWGGALAGEVGELCNIIKHAQRDDRFEAWHQYVADEIGDVLVYLDILADVLGIDLEQATTNKFNQRIIGYESLISLNRPESTYDPGN